MCGMKLYWMANQDQSEDIFRDMIEKGFEMWFSMWIQWNQLFFNAYQGNLKKFFEQFNYPSERETTIKTNKK